MGIELEEGRSRKNGKENKESEEVEKDVGGKKEERRR